MKSILVHTFIATAAAIGGNLIVAATTGDKVLAATDPEDLLVGTTDQFGVGSAGGPVGIAIDGVAQVLLGDDVANGDPITCDANSKGITCAPEEDTQKRYIGFALQAGAAGDIIDYRIAPGIIYQPAAA